MGERQEEHRWGTLGGFRGLDVLMKPRAGGMWDGDQEASRREVVTRRWDRAPDDFRGGLCRPHSALLVLLPNQIKVLS